MSREEGIQATGRIIEVLGGGRFRATLPNGKIIFAFLPKRLCEHPSAAFQIDDLVTLRLTPYDFSKGEICHTKSETQGSEI